ncbi:GNAT family N-acetyltransferase [Actinophytocola sp. KF-1]
MRITHTSTGHDERLRSFHGDMDGRFAHDVWHAEVDGEVVGTAMAGPPRGLFGPWVGELYRLEVRDGHRGQGIGARLHDECLTAWRTRGVTVGVLELLAGDAAREFFESHGWRPDGHTRTGHRGTWIRLRRTIN